MWRLRTQLCSEFSNSLFGHVRALFGFFHIGLQFACLGQVGGGNVLLQEIRCELTLCIFEVHHGGLKKFKCLRQFVTEISFSCTFYNKETVQKLVCRTYSLLQLLFEELDLAVQNIVLVSHRLLRLAFIFDLHLQLLYSLVLFADGLRIFIVTSLFIVQCVL